ncbi:putative RNA methylase [Babesia divergens]|uniref:RNA methylase n=1 Tax=Babesia divergens TaxID=32595 RepID=A0AAD9GD95_BABDI|nr:putative RNA methylase [Babesia divergens]
MVRVLFWMCMNYEYNELIDAELESLAELYGISSKELCLSHYYDCSSGASAEIDENGYYSSFNDYYAALLRGEEVADRRVPKNEQNVFYYATVPSIEVAIEIFNRCIQIKALIDLWTEGQTYPEILNKIKKNHENDVVNKLVGKRWCVKFSCFNAKSDASRLVSILQGMSEIFDRAGAVDLKNPETRIAIIERYKDDASKELRTIYFGECIRDRDDIGCWWNQYSLSTRPILAPTTLENVLAFIMVNLAKVKTGSVVLDPFVGSGGSLITASHFGGICFGSDIDMRVLKGWAVGYHNLNLPPSDIPTHVYTNFKHYGMPMPEMLRFDNRYSVWRSMAHPRQHSKEWVDAIITDPPYGIRASAKNHRLFNHGSGDDVVECLINALLDLGEAMLVPQGRLVFLLPTKNDRSDKLCRLQTTLHILNRPKLQVRHLGLQPLTGGTPSFQSNTIQQVPQGL